MAVVSAESMFVKFLLQRYFFVHKICDMSITSFVFSLYYCDGRANNTLPASFFHLIHVLCLVLVVITITIVVVEMIISSIG